MAELVSILMATTSGRRDFLEQAVRYWHRQTYRETELVVLDDSCEALEPGSFLQQPRLRHLRFPESTPIGAKINVGARQAAGDILLKLDDDDWHAPQLVAEMVKTLIAEDAKRSIAVQALHPVLFIDTMELRHLPRPRPWGGACMMFHRRVWGRRQFRDDFRGGEDADFCKAHTGDARLAVNLDEKLMVKIQHGRGQLWQHSQGMPVNDYLRTGRPFGIKLEEIMSAEDVEFYHDLHKGVAA